MQAKQLTDTEWRVTETIESVDAGGITHTKKVHHSVFLPVGATEADTLASFHDARNPPPPSADQIAAARAAEIKAACKRRIYAVASAEAQINIIGAQAAGNFDAAQEAAYAASVQWIADMRAACQALIADPTADHTDDASWPDCPPDVAALADQF